MKRPGFGATEMKRTGFFAELKIMTEMKIWGNEDLGRSVGEMKIWGDVDNEEFLSAQGKLYVAPPLDKSVP
ncbi:uncharacterized protein A4U43_C05F15230 [Asparagus officinalis]|uniref:Uncharacterized protein n=1 Tax=Asparagus officinalis TaxID=4686 RepID=A0A5P1EST7_ASPOF|nr:uncharacterized protein A4U43_C05F15230 [Asparagus officinalis]